jgi:poly-gamma-glutamate synthesis protein (capsule biosynthesis protein)
MAPALVTPTVTPQIEPLRPITSLEQVFNTTTQLPQKSEETVTLLATGDVLTARHVTVLMKQNKDFSWPFRNTAGLLQSADISFINLETPLIADCPTRSDGMVFCGELQSTEGLSFAGIDVVNIANNHASNYGPEGVAETVAHLQNKGFLVAGAANANATFTSVNGTKFAFLGFNEVNNQPGVTTAYPETVAREVSQAKEQADVVVAQFHWGNEYTYTPSENQRRLARIAIDNGADLIIGNHRQWFQPIEFYNGKLITYSHGNFVFDQMWSRETRQGIVGRYTFSKNALVGVEFIPILIENYGQPRILEAAEAQPILQTLEIESKKLLQQ